MDKLSVLTEIKEFLDGYNNDLKYLVNVETNPDNNYAECVIHEPGKEPRIEKIPYMPFMYMKDLKLLNLKLYSRRPELYESKLIQYGIKITPLKTGNQKRLKNGYCLKLTSSKSYNAIINFLRDGEIYPYEKLRNDDGREIKNKKGEPIYLYKDMFYALRTTEQFFISTQSRLFKGIEEYKHVHKITFDIETTGLRYQLSRIILIGVRDNRGLEMILEPEKPDDDEAEAKLIQDFFNLIDYLEPAIVSGYNSEEFDFDFILGRAKILKMDLSKLSTGLKDGVDLKRRGNVSVKIGNTSEKFTATEMWGYSIIDIIHAVKRTAAINSEIKANGLKYIAKFEKIARPNRTYIPGEDNVIGRYYKEDKMFVIDEKNNYLQVPEEYQEVTNKIYMLQCNKEVISDEEYQSVRKIYLDNCLEFVTWFKDVAAPKGMTGFICGKKLVKNYLLDDLWETEQVDEQYNQSSFMLAKIVPTNYQRVCTMGTASIWNLLLTAWSYENDIAIPYSEAKAGLSGGLARCFRVGYNTRIVKIDYGSLYPMLQLTWGIFPIFDITGVIHKMLLYLTTTRNIYKRLANNDKLNAEELALLKEIDHDVYRRLLSGELTDADRAMFKIKQLPIKILNNSLFGALGSGVSFNWSDNVCASRITCNGRLELRHAISWFSKYNCIALMAVTDGINFQIPITTNIGFNDNGEMPVGEECPIEQAWQYGGKTGIAALIEKFNSELKTNDESVTHDSPLYVINDNNEIDIIPISEAFNDNSKYLDDSRERDYEKKNFRVLTKSGWSNIKYVFRHKTNKKIHRIQTKDRLINITEDHSIFENGNEIKPVNLKRYDKIDVIDIPILNEFNNVNIELAWLYGFFFGDGSSVHKQRFKTINNKKIKSGNRKCWKISNTNLEYLERCINIFKKEYGIELKIINRTNSQIKSGNKLSLYEIVSFNSNIAKFYSENFYTSYREKKIPKFILNSSSEIKRSFMFGALASDGYYLSLFDVDSFGQKSSVAMAGFSYLLKSLNVEYSISTRKDKENFITFRFSTVEFKKYVNNVSLLRKSNLVWNNEIIKKYDNNYVYDISTDDETFVSGIGGILCHNTSGRENYLAADNDGEFISCLNLARINYATLGLVKDKKTREMKEKIKLTGNTIKSKVMSEYIEEFVDKGLDMILHGKGEEFVKYYYDYVDNICYLQIPLKKIASKNKVKTSLAAYKKRGNNKNGRKKGKQAHMELLIQKREKIAEELFQLHKTEFQIKNEESLEIGDKMKMVSNYMPPEPELDSIVYHVNTGYLISHGSSSKIKDKETGEERFASTLISAEDLLNNPDMKSNKNTKYNVAKYLDAFNSRVGSLLVGFSEEVQNTLLSKIVKKKIRDEFGNKKIEEEITKYNYKPGKLELKSFDGDTFEEAMFLEKKEVEFWNKTGYDPRLVWNGFSMYEEDKVYYEIYEGALQYLNDLMVKNGKPKIKSINDKYEKNDLILIKDGSTYHVGVYNGIYIEIVKENVDIPKSEIEIELDKRKAEEEQKIKNLAIEGIENEKDKYLKAQAEKRIKLFESFKKEFGLPMDVTMIRLFTEVQEAGSAFDEYVKNADDIQEEEVMEFGVDDEDSSSYDENTI